MKIKDIPREEHISNSLSCAGCSELLAVRLALKVLGKRTVAIVPAGCMSTVNCYWPQIPFKTPMFVSPFAATGAILQGVSAGFHYRGITDINVLAIAGDGGTADIGMASFSQAIISSRKFIYICVDNEAYMNTGGQWSSTTPPGALTTTSTLADVAEASLFNRKDLLAIAMAHHIPYAATASPSYPLDYLEKVRKAAATNGPSFLHVLTPCPPGWGFPSEKTIKIGRLAVESGMWPLCEYQDGQMRITYVPRRTQPVAEYFQSQKRFRKLKPKAIAQLQKMVDERREALEKKAASPE